ncbi:hypothetical protein FYJ43_04290 [Cutibacterium sp. WCA-380-WT-3A]|uniref:Uncharacterized protein n=1 Tax=Cutibacterium porci TaxID=2605781 RepID=A0A7K0J5Q9_9ACTN|nr:hypothetical protein [Cutibacterium porci]MSS45276.1 hypothetical protein [Cutibacterium porci]
MTYTRDIIRKTHTDNGDDEWETRTVPVATFTQIDNALARTLLAFVDRRNIGKAITIDETNYVLDYISQSTNASRHSRGLSVYFTVRRSVIRISDHWSESHGYPASRKLNCGAIDTAYWVINNDPAHGTISSTYHAGKHPHRLLAGICGKTVLNTTVNHWRAS